MKINSDAKMASNLGLDHLSTQIPSRVSSDDSPQNIMKAAKAFEAIFVNELMKSMRKTLPKDGLLNSGFANGVFNGMLDQEYAQLMSNSEQFGLARMIAEQMGVNPKDLSKTKSAPSSEMTPIKEQMVEIDGEHVPSWAFKEIGGDAPPTLPTHAHPVSSSPSTSSHTIPASPTHPINSSPSISKESNQDFNPLSKGEEIPSWAFEEIGVDPWESKKPSQSTKPLEILSDPMNSSLIDQFTPLHSQKIEYVRDAYKKLNGKN